MNSLSRQPQEARADLVFAGPFPVPAEGRSGIVHADDGVALRYAFWPAAAGRPHALVILLQGRTEFIERYGETIIALRDRGFDVLAFDWRGQGGSARLLPSFRKGHVEEFDDYRRDLKAVMTRARELSSASSVYGLAHSMGGAVLLDALSRNDILLDRAVLSAPMIGLSMVKHQSLLLVLARMLQRFGFSRSFIPGGNEEPLMPYENNPLTPDPLRFGISREIFATAPDLAIASPTIGWVATSFEAMARLQDPARARTISTPLLFVAGPKDRITDTRVTEIFASRLAKSKLVLIEEAEHEILLERAFVRKAFWQAWDEFLKTKF